MKFNSTEEILEYCKEYPYIFEREDFKLKNTPLEFSFEECTLSTYRSYFSTVYSME